MLFVNVILAVSWVVLTGQYTSLNFAAGFALSYAGLWLVQRNRPGVRYFKKTPLVIKFILYFAWEIILANVRVLIAVFSPLERLRPAIVAVPLDVTSDVEITMLANMITLTPGTLSLDVSHDRRVLFVHAMHVGDIDSFVQETKQGFERRVQELFT